MKDPETGKYNHTFLKQINISHNYEYVPNPASKCMICNETLEEHLDFGNNLTEIKSEESQNNYERKDKKETASYITQNKINDDKLISLVPNNTNNKKIIPVNIEISKETLELFEDPDICYICYGERITENNKVQLDCGHKFCKNCIVNHLKINILNGKVII